LSDTHELEHFHIGYDLAVGTWCASLTRNVVSSAVDGPLLFKVPLVAFFPEGFKLFVCPVVQKVLWGEVPLGEN